MIPNELFQYIWKQGYQQAQVNTPFLGVADDPTKGEIARDWRNFREEYPSGTWETQVYEFIGDPAADPTLLGITVPDGIPHAKTVGEWKPAGIRARDAGPLKEAMAEPSRVSVFVDNHEPEPMTLRAELDTYGTTANQLHRALTEAPGVHGARVYREYEADPAFSADDGQASVEEGVDVTEPEDEVSVTLELDGESVEVTNFDYDSDIEQTDDGLKVTFDPKQMEFSGSFTITWGDE